MRNIRLLIQYDGTRYQGWQSQKSSENTIQGKLKTLLTKMCGEEIELQGSGRTDTGVHARGQVANFRTSCEMPVEEMQVYINKYLPEDIAVLDVQEAAPRFHSRLNARGKCYCYQVLCGGIPDVFLRRYCTEIAGEPDMEAMRKAAAYLIGKHDFKSFTSTKRGKKPTIRQIEEIKIIKKRNLIKFTFRGNGFLYHMVRIIVGTLLEVGEGKRNPDSIKEVLAACDREKAGILAPAKGLTLMEVEYQ